ncbi:uncharacterized protein [Procambarus clarkii]|uniref:uncharacterized protein isoform X1 n=1 Tax=Procambarus clarkii TaxID=6728 RepID=UPI003743ACFA
MLNICRKFQVQRFVAVYTGACWRLLLLGVLTTGVQAEDEWSWGPESSPAPAAPTAEFPGIHEAYQESRLLPGDDTHQEKIEGKRERFLTLGERMCALGLGVCKKTYPPAIESHYGAPPAAPTSSYSTLPNDASHPPHNTHSSTPLKGSPAGFKPFFIPPKSLVGSTVLNPSYNAPDLHNYPPKPIPTYGVPTHINAGLKSTYTALAPTYAAPAPTYAAPAPTYAAPAPTYAAPAPTYAAPVPTYSAILTTYGPPTVTYTASESSYFDVQVKPSSLVHHQHTHTHIHQGGSVPENSNGITQASVPFSRPSLLLPELEAETPSLHLPGPIVEAETPSLHLPGSTVEAERPSLHLPGPTVEADSLVYLEDCLCVPATACSVNDIVARNSSWDYSALIDVRSRSSDILSNATDIEDDVTNTVVPESEDTTQTDTSEDSRVKRDILGAVYHLSDDNINLQHRQQGNDPGVSGCRGDDVCCRSPRVSQHRTQHKCGRRHAQGLLGRVKNSHFVKGDAEFGEYPWQAAVLKVVDGGDVVYVCGGALLDHQHVLTAAHCVNSLQVSQLRVRLGEWDVKTETEFYSHLELPVATVQSHPQYNAGNLHNDIALITLKTTVDFSSNPHISPVCLPDAYSSFVGQRCYSTGWGKDAFGTDGKYQSVLQEVELPVVDYHQCQEALRHTRLGPSFTLHQGMLCAGGEEGRDTCKGDGGGPLVCPDPEGRSHLGGLVSWGVDCGLPGVPGVYVDVTYFLEWLRQVGVVSSY